MNSPVREDDRRVKTIRPWSGKKRGDFASGPEMGYIYNRMASNRKQVLWAAGGSLGLHVLLLFLWAISIRWLPTPKHPAPTPPPIHLEVVKTEATPPPRLEEEPPTPTPRPFSDPSNRDPAATPPDKPAFESDQDSVAASEHPATGDGPLPTQEGKERPQFAFDTTAYTPGKLASLASAPAASAPPPKPPPVATPAPTPRVTPAPTPSHTPVPDDEFGLPPPTPTPEDTEPPFDPSVRSPSTAPERPTVASRNANASNAVGFQADQQISASRGGGKRRGEANVDSVATPLGRYKSQVAHAIRAKWYDYFYARGDMISLGTVRILITVDRYGKVLMPKVLSNSSNEALAATSIQAVLDAPIPPMPPETLAALPGGELSMDLVFNAE